MMDLDLVERSLLEVRRELSPSRADKDRVRDKLGWTALGSGPSGSPGSRSPASGSQGSSLPEPLARRFGERAALRASGKLGVALGALLFGAGVGVGLWLGSVSQARRTQSMVPAPAEPAQSALELPFALDRKAAPVRASAVVASGAELALEQTPAADRAQVPGVNAAERTNQAARSHPVVAHPQPAARVSVQPRAPVTAAREAPVDAELALLRRVERALRNADPALALALLDELEERFPQTRLLEERRAARALAECRAGSPQAQADAAEFLRAHPGSVYSERVQAACAPSSAPAAR